MAGVVHFGFNGALCKNGVAAIISQTPADKSQDTEKDIAHRKGGEKAMMARNDQRCQNRRQLNGTFGFATQ